MNCGDSEVGGQSRHCLLCRPEGPSSDTERLGVTAVFGEEVKLSQEGRREESLNTRLNTLTQMILSQVVANYLIHLIPLGVEVFINDFAGEDLGSHTHNSVRVRLALNHPFDVLILGLQVLGLYQVDTDDTLEGRSLSGPGLGVMQPQQLHLKTVPPLP